MSCEQARVLRTILLIGSMATVACAFDANTAKNKCNGPDDCIDGYRCVGGTCVLYVFSDDGGVTVPPCGAAGASCCAGNACDSGGCCVGNRCVADGSDCGALGGTCSEGSCGNDGERCGGPAQPCCGKSTCTAPNTSCQTGGICAACGGAGEPCCAGPDGCPAEGLYCKIQGGGSGVCASCGAVGERCCSDGSCVSGGCCAGDKCVADGASCGESLGSCDDGICSGCGGLDQPCCPNSRYEDKCTVGKTVCEANTCVACGGGDQPCCQGDLCDAGFVCPPFSLNDMPEPPTPQPEPGCEPCGGGGQRCCPGDRCGDGRCCVSGQCIAEGATCEGGGDITYGLCSDGACTGCGDPGQPCCPRYQCREGAVCPGPHRSSGYGSTCFACGGPAQPCCSGRICSDNLCCSEQGTCIGQGTLCGEPAAKTTVCDGKGSCGICGGLGQPCCGAEQVCSEAWTACHGYTMCHGCGGVGEVCCPDATCQGQLICVGTPSLCR